MTKNIEWTKEFARSTVRDALAKTIDDATPGLIARLPTEPAAYAELIAVTHLMAEEVDELLRESVISARHAGLTWEQVGDSMGITRLDAQRQFGPKPATAAPPPGSDLVPAAPAGALVPAGGGADPGLPPVGTRVTTHLDELAMLNRAGAYGWHGVEVRSAEWTLEFDNRQWQHTTTTGGEPAGDGWQRIGRVLFWAYWARPTNLPILPGNPDPSAFYSEKKLKKALAKRATYR